MQKDPQPKNDYQDNRFRLMVAANYLQYKFLWQAVKTRLDKNIKYRSFMKVMSGHFISGPLAEEIMQAVADLLGSTVKTLWPEKKDAAA